jgi:hypothetical protein
MFQAVGQHPQGQGLRPFDGLLSGLAVGQDTGEVDNLGYPAPVLFTFYFDR